MTIASAQKTLQTSTALYDRSFWIVAFSFLVSMAFATAPAPLYVVYQAHSNFSAFTITVIFAAYALGVVASLFTVGHLSDRVGRRKLMLPSLALGFGSALIFLFAQNLSGLLIARFVSGLGIGMLTATATAYLMELHAKAHPGTGLRKAEITATAANIGGLGMGPLVSGLLAEYAPAPLKLSYSIFAILLQIALVLLLSTPETASPVKGWKYRPQAVSVPHHERRTFAAAAMMAFVAFAMFGLFTSLAPALIRGTLGISSLAVSGGVAFLVFAAAAVMQVFSSRWPLTAQTHWGLSALAVGLVVITGSMLFASLTLLIVGGLIAGSGAGIAFKAGLGTAIRIAPEDQRGEVIAGVFLAGYLGMSVPVLLLGALMLYISLIPAVLAFGALMAGLLIVTAVLAAPRKR
ncbi:MFS transporter [Glutamicibacter sp.]|uniref:MFS transporter n=1 Tax=Glutamicibacter sp. TaxID=1931995 RepID=UPI0028BE22D9|nr:MFS transporter [Glutamicibacter sp.]